MHRILTISAIVVLIIGLPIGSLIEAQSGPRTVMVWVKDHPRPWGESQIEELLIQDLSRSSNLRVFAANTSSNREPNFPRDWTNADSLTDWALEQGCRYVLAVAVHDERLERRKGLHLPLFFHKYNTVGVVEADVRVFDVGRGRFIMTEMMTVEKKGPRVFQATMDDDINDPDLHLTTPRKLNFITKLEQEFCNKLVKRLGERIHLRERNNDLR